MKTKVQDLLLKLKDGPMKLADAAKFTSGKETISRLIRAGAIEKYIDKNPDYATGAHGQRPMCTYVKIGQNEYSGKVISETASDSTIAMAKKNKTHELLLKLKDGPMKLADAAKFTSGKETISRLIRAGAIEQYMDENPDYATGARGQRPICAYVKIGKIEYEAKIISNKASDATIAKAIRLLERNGYKVIHNSPLDEYKS